MKEPSGDRVIGPIAEASGLGSQAIGRDLQDLMPIGYPAIGSREGEAGSGSMAIGSTEKKFGGRSFGVRRGKYFLDCELKPSNS